MADKVPISFEYGGKRFTGSLDAVFGAGGNTWYLMIDKFYYGRLRINERGWFFDGKYFNDLAQYFGDYMIAWNESQPQEADVRLNR